MGQVLLSDCVVGDDILRGQPGKRGLVEGRQRLGEVLGSCFFEYMLEEKDVNIKRPSPVHSRGVEICPAEPDCEHGEKLEDSRQCPGLALEQALDGCCDESETRGVILRDFKVAPRHEGSQTSCHGSMRKGAPISKGLHMSIV